MIDYAALIGLDWGDQAHAIALQVQGLASTEKSILPHSAESLQDWINGLRARFGGRPVAVALEAKHAPVVHALMQIEFITLYPVNPKTSACYRQAFNPSGAKDDLPDADLLLDLLRIHRHKLTPWHPDDVASGQVMLARFQKGRMEGGGGWVGTRYANLHFASNDGALWFCQMFFREEQL